MQEPTTTPSFWKPRVLVVDDDPVVRLAEQHLLQRLGLAVDVAADGHEAVDMAAQWPYAAIFMDCSMPEIDGYRTTREIRTQDRPDQSPPVIAVTSRPRHVCLAAGMDHHIAKPLRVDSLRADCSMLGLLGPNDGTTDADAGSGSDIDSAAAAPLLDARLGLTPERTAELVLDFGQRSLRSLPKLWRAANLRDLDTLGRNATELRQRAEAVGAARVAALSEQMAAAAEGGDAELAAALEPQVRQALGETIELAAAQSLAPATLATPAPATPAPATPAPEPEPDRTEPPEVIRVAIADDDALARLAIEAMIRRGEGLELVGSAADADEIIRVVEMTRPDVAVVDFIMPGGGGAEAARQIRRRSPETQVIALTASEAPDTYLEMLRAGASGLLIKGTSPERLVQIIRRAVERAD